ncbi:MULTISPECIES: phosphopantetheine-binding protein [Olivibacter]|jgi:acyl carrier protein|uniref:Phosphopantetheine-binding protein n=1 Tax=Olivibacter oleidegradans TaxID=760123 RepID=A0ABV6HG88_9SPHI|nr:phosphopantetheine-binding protein [Olivibacter jilunii]
MTKKEFFFNLKDELEVEANLDEHTMIKELDEWDSMTAMVLVGYVADNFNVTISAKDLDGITDIASLIKKIGEEKFD